MMRAGVATEKKCGAVRQKIAEVRSGLLNSYWGIALGSTQNDVIYRKDKPTERHVEDERSEVYWEF
jgi:hypothetical protein